MLKNKMPRYKDLDAQTKTLYDQNYGDDARIAYFYARKIKSCRPWLILSATVAVMSFAALAVATTLPSKPPQIIVIILGGLLGGSAATAFMLGVSSAVNVWRRSRLGKCASMPQTLIRWGNGLSFTEEDDIELLEAMASHGYRMTRVSALGDYRFERSQRAGILYTADISDIKAKTEEFDQYKEIFEAGGWTYVCSAGTVHYFVAPLGTTSIYTDKSGVAQKYERLRSKNVWVAVVGAVITGACIAAITLLANTGDHATLASVLYIVAGGTFGLGIASAYGVYLSHRKSKV